MEDTFDPSSFAPQAATGSLPAEANGLSEGAKMFIRQYTPSDDDAGCIATFETVSEYKPFKSKAEREREGGDPNAEIYEPVLYIRINIRGNDKLEVHRPATSDDKRRFPFAWQEHQRGENAVSRGTPLTKLTGMDPPTLRHLHAKNVFTIEDLTSVSDNNLQNLGLGARELRKNAIEYVSTHKVATEAKEENSQLRELVEKQSAQLAQAMAVIEQLKEKRGPGRPPKAQNDGQ